MAAPKNNGNIFSKAKDAAPIKVFPVKTTANGGSDKTTVELGEDLSTLASIKVLIKSLENLATVYDAKVKERMNDEFCRRAMETGKRPLNFKGVSLKAEASCELRKRSASSYLSQEEVVMLTALEIPVAEVVVQEPVPERYFFNPEIVADIKLARKISAALKAVEELENKEVILRQPEEPAVVRQYVPDAALDAVAATKDLDIIKGLLPVVSTLAIRVKLMSSELGEAINMIKNSNVEL